MKTTPHLSHTYHHILPDPTPFQPSLVFVFPPCDLIPTCTRRTIENNATPFVPEELGGEVEFVVFASDPPLLQETTVFLKSRHAIVLGDLVGC